MSEIIACFFDGNDVVTCAYGRLELTVDNVLEEPPSLYSVLNWFFSFATIVCVASQKNPCQDHLFVGQIIEKHFVNRFRIRFLHPYQGKITTFHFLDMKIGWCWARQIWHHYPYFTATEGSMRYFLFFQTVLLSLTFFNLLQLGNIFYSY